MISQFLLLHIISFSALCLSSSFSEENSLYTDVTLANTTESLNRVFNVPLKVYGFKYDSVADRRQLGILGSDAQRWFPDSVEVLPSHAVPTRNKTAPMTILKNFPMVNKQVIYMHGMAALQELGRLFEALRRDVVELRNSGTDHGLVFAEIERRLAKEADEQLLERRKLAEAEAELARKEVALEVLRAEEDRKSIEQDLLHEKQMLDYEEELARERMVHGQTLAKSNIERSLALEREMVLKREEMRKQLAESLAEKRLFYERQFEELKVANEKEKIVAEIRAKAEQERLNEDVTIRKLQAQSRLDTEKMVQGIRTISQQVSRIVVDLVSRPQQLAIVAGLLFLVLAVYYAIREFTTLLRQFIQSRLGRPSLIRETSRETQYIPSVILDAWSKVVGGATGGGAGGEGMNKNVDMLQDHFSDVILNDQDKDRVIQLALTTRNTKKTGAPYRHVLLYGPPGTGKTMIARKLAECSNMDYAIMSGGDVGPLGEDAVSQLHSLFRWAASSRKGLLLFIDEAEAFLSSRNNHSQEGGSGSGEGGGGGGGGGAGDNVSIHIRHALNALLYQTGTQSTTFMLVLATNRPEDLDAAVLDRIDVSHFIGFPARQQRADLIAQYYTIHVNINAAAAAGAKEATKEGKGSKKKAAEGDIVAPSIPCGLPVDVVDRLSGRLEGFSGREIAKLFIAVKYAVILPPTSLPDPASAAAGGSAGDAPMTAERAEWVERIVNDVAAQKIREHRHKHGLVDE